MRPLSPARRGARGRLDAGFSQRLGGTHAVLDAGTSALRLLLGRRLRIKGKRRRALKLRRLSQDLSMRAIARAGVEPDPNLVYKALPYAIDPAWTDGHRFCLKYEMLE